MAPWDENQYYQLPVINYITLTGNKSQQLVKADPYRVGILVACPNTPAGPITISPDPTLLPQAATLFNGVQIGSDSPPLWISHDTHKALVSAEWWVANNQASSFSITTIELKLYQWPHEVKGARDFEAIARRLRQGNELSGISPRVVQFLRTVRDNLLSRRGGNGHAK
jgi:hypothetical protein